MLDRLNKMVNKPDVPNLYIAERVVQQMATAAQQYLEDETGEAMIGLVVPPEDATDKTSVYVMDTIAPGADALRASHTFQQGGAWQDDVLNWLRENWEIARKQRDDSEWDAPLYHIGDWHKQPGFMIQPSGGDLQTAQALVNETRHHFGFTVAPILTIDHPPTVTAPPKHTNYLRIEQPNGLMTRIDFWYLAQGMRSFFPISAEIVADDTFPPLMPYPWHLVSEQRAAQEMQLLEGDNLLVDVLLWNTDDELPLEICFLTARPGASQFVLLATPHDYPNRPPAAYTLPFSSVQPDEDLYALLERSWTDAEAVNVDDFTWSPEKTLLEYLFAVEQTLGIGPEREPAPAAEPHPAAEDTSTSEETADE